MFFADETLPALEISLEDRMLTSRLGFPALDLTELDMNIHELDSICNIMWKYVHWHCENQDAIAYTSVLDAWASSGRTEKALKTFREMKQKRFAFA